MGLLLPVGVLGGLALAGLTTAGMLGKVAMKPSGGGAAGFGGPAMGRGGGCPNCGTHLEVEPVAVDAGALAEPLAASVAS